MKNVKERSRITEELRKKYSLEENIIDLTLDVAFKKVLSMECNKWYLSFIISYCTKLDVDYIMKNLEFKNDSIAGKDIGKKTGRGDLIVEIENKIINLEMNREVTESLIRKNKWYVDTLNSNSMDKRSKRNKKYIIQINISTKQRIPDKEILMYEIVRMDRNLLVEDVYNNEIIYDINLAYLKDELYNKDKLNQEEKRLVIFIEKRKEKLKELYKGDENMKDTIENLEEVGYLEDEGFAIEYDKEALDEQIRKEALEEAIEQAKKEGREKGLEIGKIEGIKQGIEQGIEQGIKQGVKQGVKQGIAEGRKNACFKIAKNMLEVGTSIEEISKITELTFEEIKNLKEEMK